MNKNEHVLNTAIDKSRQGMESLTRCLASINRELVKDRQAWNQAIGNIACAANSLYLHQLEAIQSMTKDKLSEFTLSTSVTSTTGRMFGYLHEVHVCKKPENNERYVVWQITSSNVNDIVETSDVFKTEGFNFTIGFNKSGELITLSKISEGSLR